MSYLVKQRVWLPLYNQHGIVKGITLKREGNIYKIKLEDGSIEFVNETQIKSTK
jgi:hypothetical protein